MKSKKIIGLTGSIATGKSTVAKIISELGYRVIDADKVAHSLMLQGGVNYKLVVEYFGTQILGDDLEIDRSKLGELVFSSKERLEMLNKLTHDNIFHEINVIIKEIDEDVIFVEIPLLIELLLESKLKIELDQIWLVYVDSDEQIKRLMNRNSFTYEEAEKRVKSQIEVGLKKKYSDYIIENDKDLSHLKDQIIEGLERINEDYS